MGLKKRYYTPTPIGGEGAYCLNYFPFISDHLKDLQEFMQVVDIELICNQTKNLFWLILQEPETLLLQIYNTRTQWL